MEGEAEDEEVASGSLFILSDMNSIGNSACGCCREHRGDFVNGTTGAKFRIGPPVSRGDVIWISPISHSARVRLIS